MLKIIESLKLNVTKFLFAKHQLFPGLQIIKLSAVGLQCIGKIGRNGQLDKFQLSGHVTLPFNCIWVYDYLVESIKIKLLNTFQGFCSIEK